MLVELDEAKNWLRVDDDMDDLEITSLIKASEQYIKNATGKQFSKEHELARLLSLFLITEWYEGRELTGNAMSEKSRFVVQSMVLQLQTEGESDESGTS